MGLHAGWSELFQDRADHAAYLDSLQQPVIHHTELIEAGGSDFARAYVG
jgi:hypothetical protein